MEYMESKNIIKILETREVTKKKNSILGGLITWYQKVSSQHKNVDLVIELKTELRHIYILRKNQEPQIINVEELAH